jgi:hypothetical protein
MTTFGESAFSSSRLAGGRPVPPSQKPRAPSSRPRPRASRPRLPTFDNSSQRDGRCTYTHWSALCGFHAQRLTDASSTESAGVRAQSRADIPRQTRDRPPRRRTSRLLLLRRVVGHAIENTSFCVLTMQTGPNESKIWPMLSYTAESNQGIESQFSPQTGKRLACPRASVSLLTAQSPLIAGIPHRRAYLRPERLKAAHCSRCSSSYARCAFHHHSR